MRKKILGVAMLGMNSSSQRDTDHAFKTAPYEKSLPITWLPQVRKHEKQTSTCFYETARTVDEIRVAHGLSREDIRLVFGRGTIGDGSDSALAGILPKLCGEIGDDAFKFAVVKSYGAVDLLRAFQILSVEERDAVGLFDLLIIVDGYGPFWALKRVSKRYGYSRRFTIMPLFKRVHAVVQRSGWPKGLTAGRGDEDNIYNRVISPEDVEGRIYDRYCDGHIRELEVCHKHMEEIVSVIPCCLDDDGTEYTVWDLIGRLYERHIA